MTVNAKTYKPAHGGYPGMVLRFREGRLLSALHPQPGYPTMAPYLRGTETAYRGEPRRS